VNKHDVGGGPSRDLIPNELEPAPTGPRVDKPLDLAKAPPVQRSRTQTKVLFLAANAVAAHRVALDQEHKAIVQKLRAAPWQSSFELISCWAVDFDELRRCLLEHSPDIVHFAGHSNASSELMLLDEKGEPAPLSGSALSSLLRALPGNVSLVVLNACFSAEQAATVRESVGLAVGMSEAIDDKAAIAFSGAFYEALAFGHSVGKAFALGVNAIEALGVNQAHVPKLLVREGVDADRTFFAPNPPAASKPSLTARLGTALRRRRGLAMTSTMSLCSVVAAYFLWFSKPPMPLIEADPADATNNCARLREARRVGRSPPPRFYKERLVVYHNSAELMASKGKHELAGALHECVLELKKEAFGARDLQVVETVVALAKTYKNRGKYAEAMHLLEESLGNLESLYKNDSLELFPVISLMCEVSKEAGDKERAGSLCGRAVLIDSRNPGGVPLRLAEKLIENLEALAQLHRQRGDEKAADETLARACVVREALNRNEPPSSCPKLIDRDDWPTMARFCGAESEAEQGLPLGRVSIKGSESERCRQMVRPLLESPYAADAHSLMGKIALKEGATAEASAYFEQALGLREQCGQAAAFSRDAIELAGLLEREGKYAAALTLTDRAEVAAKRNGQARLVFYTHLARAHILRAGGDYFRAETVIQSALTEVSSSRERAWAMLTMGLLYVDSERDALAVPPLREALILANEIGLVEVERSARLNLAWLARRRGELAEAEAVFTSPSSDDDPVVVAYNRGLVATDRGDLEGAAAHFAHAEKVGLKGSLSWSVPYHAGLIDERRGRHIEAQNAYRRSVAALERLRDDAGPLAAHVVAAHQMPHRRLIGLFAHEARWHDVLGVVLSLDLSMMLATRARPRELSNESPDVARTLTAWRDRRLIVLAPGIGVSDSDNANARGGRLWRLEVFNGSVQGVDVGSLARLEQLAASLEANPNNREAARELGEAIVPASSRGQTLDVLALGSVARAPLGALRHGDALVASSTPLARVLGLRAWSRPNTIERRAGAVVLGDPFGNLPAASQEALRIADRFGSNALLGPAANRAALASAAGAALLHVASHATETAEGPTLHLADGGISATNLPLLGPTASLVMLTSDASAASRDGSGWGSLAAAFLGAGAEAVVATQWSITDADAARVAEALCEQDIDHDILRNPVAALAEAQVRLERTVPASAWAAFTVVRAPPVLISSPADPYAAFTVVRAPPVLASPK
jgi:tetratricopeptide (TPR) repeat protein/CHAT domain-containing protein